MRRILLLAVGVLALAFAVPGVASAHRGHAARGHHRRHHHHHVKAHHARLERFGAPSNTSPSGDQSAPGDAGTVTSFDNGVLTITLADGSVVRGAVTSDTEINCVQGGTTPGPTAGTSSDHGDQGDDQGDQSGGDQNGGDQNGGDQSGGDQNGGDQSRCQGQSACTAADLVPGAVVHEAILKIGANGAEFKLVLLVKQQQASS